MKIGKVKGKIWATRKADSLADYKLLQVELQDNDRKSSIVAIDTVDAGQGDTVLIVGGSSARTGEVAASMPVDATIIAVIDKKE